MYTTSAKVRVGLPIQIFILFHPQVLCSGFASSDGQSLIPLISQRGSVSDRVDLLFFVPRKTLHGF